MRDADGEVGGAAQDFGVEGAAEEGAAAGEAQVRRAPERALREAREDGEVGGGDARLTGDGEVAVGDVERAGAFERVAFAVEVEAVDAEGLTLLAAQHDAARDAFAQRRDGGGVGEVERFGGEVEVDGEGARVDGAPAVERDLFRRDVGAVEAVDAEEAGPGVAGGGVETGGEGDAVHARFGAGDREEDRAPVAGGDAAVEVEAPRGAAGGERQGAVERDGAGGEAEGVEVHRAVGATRARHVERDVRPEEVAVVGREERRHVARQLRAEGARVAGGEPFAADGEGSGKAGFAVGGQRQGRLEVRERPLPRHVEIDGRRPRQAREGRHDPARRFGQGRVERQDAGRVREGGVDGEDALRAVEAGDVDAAGPLAPFERERPFEGEGGGEAEDGRADGDGGRGDAADVHRQRQFGEAEARRLGRWHVAARVPRGQAREVDPVCREVLHRKPPAEEGRAAPVERDAFEREPDALIVGDGQALHRGGGAECAAEARDADVAARAREVAFERAFKERRAAFLLREKRGGQEDEEREEPEEPHQNACPMPM